jgi:hypothetical protein
MIFSVFAVFRPAIGSFLNVAFFGFRPGSQRQASVSMSGLSAPPSVFTKIFRSSALFCGLMPGLRRENSWRYPLVELIRACWRSRFFGNSVRRSTLVIIHFTAVLIVFPLLTSIINHTGYLIHARHPFSSWRPSSL